MRKITAYGFIYKVLAENKTHVFGKINSDRIYEIPKRAIEKMVKRK